MTFVARRRIATRAIVLDRSLESLPIFRLSDSAEDTAISFSPESGGRWRVLPSPGDRLPGTFDQDVYIELHHRYHEAGAPEDGVVSFTLHAFLRSIGRRVDGRTYEQLPLTQRYPSHLKRVLQPAHEMLLAAGLLRDATFRQLNRDWLVDYVLASQAA